MTDQELLQIARKLAQRRVGPMLCGQLMDRLLATVVNDSRDLIGDLDLWQVYRLCQLAMQGPQDMAEQKAKTAGPAAAILGSKATDDKKRRTLKGLYGKPRRQPAKSKKARKRCLRSIRGN